MKTLSFLQLTYKRFISKQPKYFKIITNISVACGVIVGMPEFLDLFDIKVPLLLAPYVTKMITAAAFVSALIAKLTVENPNDLNNNP